LFSKVNINLIFLRVILSVMGDISTIDKSLRILIIDDDGPTRKLIKLTLKALGFKNIIEAANGMDGLMRLRMDESVKLVICDWRMPELVGIEVLREIREDEHYQDLPFLMLTSETKKEQVLEAIELKVSDYMAKPVTYAGLREKLENLLGDKER